MSKLSEAQIKALIVLNRGPVRITMWGGKPFAGMPEGIRSRPTLYGLLTRGYAKLIMDGPSERWIITRSGSAMLQETVGITP